MKKFAFLIVVLQLTLSSAFAQDSTGFEKIGRLTVDEILLRPTYVSRENQGGEFSFSDSSFRVRWQKDAHISATVAVGSVLQKNTPAIYAAAEPTDTLGFYEAYADYQGLYGRVRAGLQPLHFGFYGARSNAELILPRPLLYSERVVGLRDFGLSFYTAHNGFFTELVAHNGEADNKPQDGNIWVTARWGWGNDRNIRVQLSAQTGRTKPVATTAGSTTLAGWDRQQSSLWRMGAFSIHWYPRRWEVTAQVTGGEREQEKQKAGLFSTQFEVLNYMGKHWGAGVRHDHYEENDKLSGDGKTQLSGVVFVKNEDSTSLMSVVLSKNFEEKNEVPNDQVLVSWRITPFVGR